MGAKASTANGNGPGHPQSPRPRTFSTSSSSAEVVTSSGTAGFNLLRALPGMHITTTTASADRQRARSLSSVPDLQQHDAANQHSGISIPPSRGGTANGDDAIQQTEHDENIAAAAAGALALGRVYTATSLPSHIWSLNGMYNNCIDCLIDNDDNDDNDDYMAAVSAFCHSLSPLSQCHQFGSIRILLNVKSVHEWH